MLVTGPTASVLQVRRNTQPHAPLRHGSVPSQADGFYDFKIGRQEALVVWVTGVVAPDVWCFQCIGTFDELMPLMGMVHTSTAAAGSEPECVCSQSILSANDQLRYIVTITLTFSNGLG